MVSPNELTTKQVVERLLAVGLKQAILEKSDLERLNKIHGKDIEDLKISKLGYIKWLNNNNYGY